MLNMRPVFAQNERLDTVEAGSAATQSALATLRDEVQQCYDRIESLNRSLESSVLPQLSELTASQNRSVSPGPGHRVSKVCSRYAIFGTHLYYDYA